MGRDEHTKRKNSRLAQTPKNQLMDGMMNVDYLEEFSDETTPEAQEINEAVQKRQRKK